MANNSGMVEARLVERLCRAMQAVSRPDVDPDQLTPGPRGSVGYMRVWQLYEHMARAAVAELAYRDGIDEQAAITIGKKLGHDPVTVIECYDGMLTAALAPQEGENGD